MQNFCEKLKDYREQRGWSRKYVSDNAKIPMNTIWAWEEGKRIPPEYVQGLLFNKLDGLGLPKETRK